MLPSDLPNRKRLRLEDHDYNGPATYFVTICAARKETIFGDICGGCFYPTIIGDAIRSEWEQIPARFSSVLLGAFVVMPNHMHGLLTLQSASTKLGVVIGHFKSIAVMRVRSELSDREALIWHRGYHDRIVRNPGELSRVRHYIEQNPANWDHDEHYIRSQSQPEQNVRARGGL